MQNILRVLYVIVSLTTIVAFGSLTDMISKAKERDSVVQRRYYYRVTCYFGTEYTISNTTPRLSQRRADEDLEDALRSNSDMFYAEPDSVKTALIIDMTGEEPECEECKKK